VKRARARAGAAEDEGRAIWESRHGLIKAIAWLNRARGPKFGPRGSAGRHIQLPGVVEVGAVQSHTAVHQNRPARERNHRVANTGTRCHARRSKCRPISRTVRYHQLISFVARVLSTEQHNRSVRKPGNLVPIIQNTFNGSRRRNLRPCGCPIRDGQLPRVVDAPAVFAGVAAENDGRAVWQCGHGVAIAPSWPRVRTPQPRPKRCTSQYLQLPQGVLRKISNEAPKHQNCTVHQRHHAVIIATGWAPTRNENLFKFCPRGVHPRKCGHQK